MIKGDHVCHPVSKQFLHSQIIKSSRLKPKSGFCLDAPRVVSEDFGEDGIRQPQPRRG